MKKMINGTFLVDFKGPKHGGPVVVMPGDAPDQCNPYLNCTACLNVYVLIIVIYTYKHS